MGRSFVIVVVLREDTGWPADLSDEQILEKLFKLNQERAAAQ